MKTMRVTICTGTACYILGGSELLLLEENLRPELRRYLSIEGSPCLGLCKGEHHEHEQVSPCVLVDGKLHRGVTLQALAAKLEREIEARTGGE